MLKRWRNSLYRKYESKQREAYERPTPYIYLLIFILVGLFSQAYFHNYNIVYLALFFTFSIALSAYYFGRENIKNIDFSLENSRVFTNLSNSLSFKLEPKEYVFNVYLSDKDETEIAYLSDIRKTTFSTLHFHSKTRGFAKLPSYKLLSKFPLPHQVFYKIKNFDSILVYPEPNGINLQNYINLQKEKHGDIDDFNTIRAFRTSDKLSSIHWPLYASSKKLYTKEYNFNEEKFDLFFDYEHCANDKESRLSQLTLWTLECERTQKEFSIKMPHELLQSKKMSTDEILTKLALF